MGAVALVPRVRTFPTIRARPSRRGMTRSLSPAPDGRRSTERLPRLRPARRPRQTTAPGRRRVLPSSARDCRSVDQGIRVGPLMPVFSSSWMLCACQASTAEAPAATTPTPTRVQPLTRIARRRPRPASSSGEVAVCVLTATGGGATGAGSAIVSWAGAGVVVGAVGGSAGGASAGRFLRTGAGLHLGAALESALAVWIGRRRGVDEALIRVERGGAVVLGAKNLRLVEEDRRARGQLVRAREQAQRLVELVLIVGARGVRDERARVAFGIGGRGVGARGDRQPRREHRRRDQERLHGGNVIER